jgi:hypothetical protein
MRSSAWLPRGLVHDGMREIDEIHDPERRLLIAYFIFPEWQYFLLVHHVAQPSKLNNVVSAIGLFG